MNKLRKFQPPIDSRLIKFNYPNVIEEKFSNGLTLLVIEQPHLPKVSVRMGFDFGSKNDIPNKMGLCQLLSATLKKGTRDKNYFEIVKTIESVGGSLEIAVSEDFFFIYGDFLVEYLNIGMQILQDIILNPVFPSLELEKERLREIADLENDRSSPEYLAHRRMSQAIFSPHPYCQYRNKESLQNISREDLIHFYHDLFIPNISYLVLAGRIDRNQAMNLVEEYFGLWKAKPYQPRQFESSKKIVENSVHLIHRPGSTQSNILLGNILFSRNHKDYETMLVMNKILGGGGSGRLFMYLRETKGFTYGAYSNLFTYKETGAFLANTDVRTEVTSDAIYEILGQYKNIKNCTVSTTELQDAKRYIIGIFPLQNETPASIGSLALKQKLYNLSENYWTNYLKKINSVTLLNVQQVANKYISEDQMIIVVVGDADKLSGQLSEYGKLRIYDLDDQMIQ